MKLAAEVLDISSVLVPRRREPSLRGTHLLVPIRKVAYAVIALLTLGFVATVILQSY